MSSRAETVLGLTPVLKRMAHYYLCLGYGEYQPQNHPHYNRVVVRELYEFIENPQTPGEHAGGVLVEFFQDDRRIRWVEFKCQVTGGGGDAVIKRVK